MDWAVLGHARMCMCVFEQKKKKKKKREGRRRKTAIGRCLGLVRCLVTADFARGVVAVNLVRLEEHVQALLVPCKRVVRNPEGQARCRHEDAVGVERGRERARRGGEGRKGGGKEASCVCVCVCAFSGLCAPKERHEQNILVNEILKALSALFDKVWGEHTWKPHRHMRANTNTGATQAVQ